MSLVTVNGEYRSTATTAYALLDDLVTLVERDPLRMYLADWIVTDPSEQLTIATCFRVPACGTLGCIAGWICLLTNTRTHSAMAGIAARDILGKPTVVDLFSAPVVLPQQSSSQYGTPAYARLVIDRIRSFQREHEAHLRAQPVVPGVRATVDTQEPELVGV